MRPPVHALVQTILWLLLGQSVAAAADQPITGICSSNAAGNRGCRPAPGSPDENMPKATLPGQRLEIKKQIALPQQQPGWQSSACQAQTTISYSQRFDTVVVDALIENTTCMASRGEYEIRLRWRDAQGTSHLATHQEQWQRSARQAQIAPIPQRHRYTINPEHQLQWAKVVSRPKTACTCTKASATYTP